MLLGDPLGGPFQARFLRVRTDALIELLRKPLPGCAEVAGNAMRTRGQAGLHRHVDPGKHAVETIVRKGVDDL